MRRREKKGPATRRAGGFGRGWEPRSCPIANLNSRCGEVNNLRNATWRAIGRIEATITAINGRCESVLHALEITAETVRDAERRCA
jgi:hypothetical protein